MNLVADFRDPKKAAGLIDAIAKAARSNKTYRFMEFCGGHTHVLSRWGLTDCLPENVRMIHGPGCPVCVLPIARIELAIDLALEHKAIVCTYGDTLRVPAAGGRTLFSCRALGGDVRMVYSPSDALKSPEKTRTVRWYFLPSDLKRPRRRQPLLPKRPKPKEFATFRFLSVTS